jgi:hypothetical protein
MKGIQPTRNDPTTINGRIYTGHALDQMQNRGLVPSIVESTIGGGIPFSGNQPGTMGYFDPTNNLRIIVNSQGSVITVMFGKPK